MDKGWATSFYMHNAVATIGKKRFQEIKLINSELELVCSSGNDEEPT